MPKPKRKLGSTPRTPVLLDGKPVPCLLKVVIYHAGQAAGLGLQASDPPALARLLGGDDRVEALRQALRQAVAEEMLRVGATYGVQEDQIQEAIDEFLEKASLGSTDLVSRRIAEGEAPTPGTDARLEYRANPDGLPLHALGRRARSEAAQRVHRVIEGEKLVERHPPEAGGGITVRGEAAVSDAPRDVSLKAVAGANTRVVGQKILAGTDGICREDRRGVVRVVQELAVPEVNAGTGNLPKSGTAHACFAIAGGVRSGFGVFTEEDVLVGVPGTAAALDEGTRIQAGQLVVHGQVAGQQLPEAFVAGEVDALPAAEQRKVARQVEAAQIDVEGLFAAREVLARSVSAGTILVQGSCQRAALAVDDDVLVDGDLTGGVVAFGRRLQVLGDLGNAEGTRTRIRLGTGARADRRRERLRAQHEERRSQLTHAREAIDEHVEQSEQRGKRDPYWAALAKGEKRPPRGGFEKRILEQFLEAARVGRRLQSAAQDAEREVKDLQRALAQLDEEETAEVDTDAIEVVVGGTLHPGVRVERVRPVEDEDLPRVVRRQAGDATPVPLQVLRDELAGQVADYLAPRQEAAEARAQAQAQIFKDRAARPEAAGVANRRFQAALHLDVEADAEARGGHGSAAFSREAELFVFSAEPRAFFLKLICGVREPQQGVRLVLSEADGLLTIEVIDGDAPVGWQRDPAMRMRLGAIDVLGVSGADLLLTPAAPG